MCVCVQLEKRFRVLWADHGDMISIQYAGTGALKADFVRTGHRSIFGLWDDGLKSAVRYFLNNFEDGQKQDSFDLITGNFRPRAVCCSLMPHLLCSFVTFVFCSHGSVGQRFPACRHTAVAPHLRLRCDPPGSPSHILIRLETAH